jgi:hypothetical protein
MGLIHQLSQPINFGIFLGMLVVFVILYYFRRRATNRFLKEIKKTISKVSALDGVASDKLIVQKINEIVKQNNSLKDEYKHFENSQIEVDENSVKKIYASHKIEEYIKFDRVFALSRFLDDGGSYLTGIGLLITFIMIALGLSELKLNDTQALQTGIAGLINSLSGKFIGSICGIGGALLYNWRKDRNLTEIEKQIKKFNDLINEKINNKYSENVLHDINLGIKSQTEDLKEFFSGNVFSNAILEAFDKRKEQSRTIELLTEIKLAIERQNGSELATNISGLVDKLSTSVGDISGKQVFEMSKQLESFQSSMQNTQEDMKAALDVLTKDMLKNLSESSAARMKTYDEENNNMIIQLKQNMENIYGDFARQKSLIQEEAQVNYDLLRKNQEDILGGFNQQAKVGLELIQSNLTKYSELFNQLDGLLQGYKQSMVLGQAVIDDTKSTLSTFNQSSIQLNTIHTNLGTISANIKPLVENLVSANSSVKTSLAILENKEKIVNDGLTQLMQSFATQMQTWQTHIDNTQSAMNDTNEVIKLLDGSVTHYTTEYQDKVTSFVDQFTTKLGSIIGNIQEASGAIQEFTEKMEEIVAEFTNVDSKR